MSNNPTKIEPLFIDDNLIVINKPSGLLSIQDGYNDDLPNLFELLKKFYGSVLIVHRLDKDTSGVIVFARNAKTHKQLNVQFTEREVYKEYHALIKYPPYWSKAIIRYPLRINADRKHRTRVDTNHGKPAQTTCQVVERYSTSALIQATPSTGYTHQIRAHLSAINHPIVGDRIYGIAQKITENDPLMNRPALHASAIRFVLDNASFSFTAPYPKDFLDVLERNKSGAVQL